MRDPRLRRLLIPTSLLLALSLVGTVGYRVLEGWPWSECAYMVFITVSTVGFGEVHPLDPAGRIWTILLIVTGVGTVGFTVAQALELLLEGWLHGIRRKRRMEKAIEDLSGHWILCGYGRVGREVYHEFLSEEASVVVIDPMEELSEAVDEGVPHIVGSAHDEEILRRAGIERAQGLITAVDSDTENVFITLTAKVLNPDLKLIARASQEDTIRKLQMVGAERVVSPYVTAGRRMAAMALQPAAVDFLDFFNAPLEELSLRIEEVKVVASSDLAGKTLAESDLRRHSSAIVVALRSEGQTLFNPGANTRIPPGATLILLGTAEQCQKVQELAR